MAQRIRFSEAVNVIANAIKRRRILALREDYKGNPATMMDKIGNTACFCVVGAVLSPTTMARVEKAHDGMSMTVTQLVQRGYIRPASTRVEAFLRDMMMIHDNCRRSGCTNMDLILPAFQKKFGEQVKPTPELLRQMVKFAKTLCA